jgi:hypothetical protein
MGDAEAMTALSIVMCHTEGCPSAEKPLPMALAYVAAETGEMRVVDAIVCGGCGEQIADIAAEPA